MGRGKSPNIAVTWHAAMEFARWISSKTGKSYRLPTEAEWEYACRAGSRHRLSVRRQPAAKLGDHAWFAGNAGKKPHVVGGKQPNAFGLFDMHGNVSEWVIDRYAPDFYAKPAERAAAGQPAGRRRATRTSCAAAAGRRRPPALRCAARRFSEPIWSKQDPQTPQSIWWHTEATEVGFRLVHVPDEYPALRGFRSKMTDGEPEQVSPAGQLADQ